MQKQAGSFMTGHDLGVDHAATCHFFDARDLTGFLHREVWREATLFAAIGFPAVFAQGDDADLALIQDHNLTGWVAMVVHGAALATRQKHRHNRYQTFHAVLQDALPLEAKITSKICLKFKHNVVCENHSQILTPFGIVIAQALFVVSHMLYSSASFIH
jgi:hypothetical protein